MTLVVPRTGYVDRNNLELFSHFNIQKSYPARGTWIEILLFDLDAVALEVVPRTGYVDRNNAAREIMGHDTGRTPHGVRG